LRDSLDPGKGRARLFKMPVDRALKQLAALIAVEGEQPSLLLIKALLTGRRDFDRAMEKLTEANYDEPIRIRGRNQGLELLQRILSRRPDYAPAYYAYGTEDFVGQSNSAAKVTALTKYVRLRPLDSRGWHWLGYEQSRLRNFGEAEIAYRESVRLAPSDKWCVEGLFDFYLRRDERAKLLELLKGPVRLLDVGGAEYLYWSLNQHVALFEEAQLRDLEAILLETPDRLADSKSSLLLLAFAQVRLGKSEAARSTIQRIHGLSDLEDGDYIRLAWFNRELRFYEDAADAARKAISLEKYSSGAAYLHLACALAQLDRKQEAIDALRKYEEAPMRLIGIDYRGEPDLKPLVDMPEFKELTRKYVQVESRPAYPPGKRSGAKKRPK
jgi:predicted Zn-dependent protease